MLTKCLELNFWMILGLQDPSLFYSLLYPKFLTLYLIPERYSRPLLPEVSLSTGFIVYWYSSYLFYFKLNFTFEKSELSHIIGFWSLSFYLWNFQNKKKFSFFSFLLFYLFKVRNELFLFFFFFSKQIFQMYFKMYQNILENLS